jgi:hypothetical protein
MYYGFRFHRSRDSCTLTVVARGREGVHRADKIIDYERIWIAFSGSQVLRPSAVAAATEAASDLFRRC